MTISILRALHGLIGEALDDIERVFNEQNAASPPELSSTVSEGSTPHSPKHIAPPLDFPSLDAPYDPNSSSERLVASSPVIRGAISRIVAACGQLSASTREPFLSLCDGSMGYHLPSCLRLLEASNTVEILREAGENGLHVKQISEKNGVDPKKLAHILRLLSTHHYLRELRPDVFANNRVSSYMDTGKNIKELNALSKPEQKYEGTNGISAFVGMCSDELFKSAAYMTEAYYLNPTTKYSTSPTETPFNFAFRTRLPLFGWFENGAPDPVDLPREITEGTVKLGGDKEESFGVGPLMRSITKFTKPSESSAQEVHEPPSKFRLERFGKAMEGTSSWESPGGIVHSGYDWSALPAGSIVVDLGGGIGSACMALAENFRHLKFVVQDREAVTEMGVKMWQERFPELLASGTTTFQVHDVFDPQPIKKASIFILRAILHDWPDDFARKILIRLREAAVDEGDQPTTLIIADHILPLACVDDLQGNPNAAELGCAATLSAPPPLLANLGKASANVYWMDMTMHTMFNAQERTLGEIVALAISAGWQVRKVAQEPGSLFGHLLAVPIQK